jgi:hypothetical protein
MEESRRQAVVLRSFDQRIPVRDLLCQPAYVSVIHAAATGANQQELLVRALRCTVIRGG